jgi:hypothetical protein
MSVPDPVTTGIVVGTTLGLAKEAKDFIAAASGHKGESIGTILGDIVQRRRNNAETVIGRSHLILLNIGVKAGEVPLNVLQPMIEGASLQEDPTLQEIWANLLANAADPRKKNPVEPSFAGILRELSSREVIFLDALSKETNGVWDLTFSEASLIRVSVEAGLAQPDYVVPPCFRL